MKQLILVLLLLTAGSAATYYMVNSKPKAEKKPPKPVIPLVETVPIQPGSQQLTVMSRGLVSARTQGSLVPQVGGEIIAVSEHYQNGGRFNKGDILLSIDPRDYQADVTVAESELAQAEVQYSEEQARSAQALKNWQRLGNRGQPNDLTLRKPQLARAKASVAAAKARLSRAKLALERCEIKAPYDGVIQQKIHGLGQVVNRGQIVANILATDFAEIQLPVAQKQLAALDLPAQNLNLDVTLSLDAKQQTWRGKIKRQAAEINRQTRQTTLIAEVEQPLDSQRHGARLELGQHVNAQILGRRLNNVFSIPRSAVVRDKLMYKFVDQQLKAIEIDILWRQENHVVVANPNQSSTALNLVVNPPAFAYDGMAAKISSDSSNKSAGDSETGNTDNAEGNSTP